ncbi:MarR family winged helix-turn-helix transcriptional regulator [Williamsia deligens]|uniref:MarR family winged helix-turn-helix transcriptional regulator n=1 Tax=Williamsia deligens TaxID=321325 RepID=A0ABW3G733_9NOCA|nr:MarR family transcriptional regulator [Williamsia deligens]MCP2192697.1 DNA-binding transcriptional regulator, MarR family [Williamsia deligens]
MDDGSTPLILLLARAVRAVETRVAEVLADAALSLDQWRVLVVLESADGMTMSDLARASVLSPAGATRAIDALVDRAMVYRRVDPTDRRRVVVFLSAHGVAVIAPILRDVASAEREMATMVGARRYLALGDGLTHLVDGDRVDETSR